MQDQSDQSQKPKRRRRKAARPAEIIAAAMALWAERGFAATRLEDVAAGAGVAKGTIYLYFASKEALFEAAVQERLLAVVDQPGLQPSAFSGSTEQMLRRFLSAIYGQVSDAGLAVLLKVLISEGHRFPQLVRFYHDAAITRIIALIGAVLRRGVAQGDIREGLEALDPRLIVAPALALGLWGMVFRAGPPAGTRPAPTNDDPGDSPTDGPVLQDAHRYMEAHLDLLLHGLLRPTP
tara:strand:+ start:1590 stop:2297 length:708 start_codon:yes stop_codon:yes gene_type:complete